MALSTTATATHALLKYSQSNPSSAPGGPEEWQHYMNPVLTLILDTKKSWEGELESVRLRVIWTMNNTGNPMGTEVVFEDLDLLTFSTLKPLKIHPPQGLPLKAVYKDSVVGIRYLYPLAPTRDETSPVYRRFQVTFTTPLVAAQFVDSIRHVCPCKPNVPPAPGRTFSMMPPPPARGAPLEATVEATVPGGPFVRRQRESPVLLSSSVSLPEVNSTVSAVDSSSSPRRHTPQSSQSVGNQTFSSPLHGQLDSSQNQVILHSSTIPVFNKECVATTQGLPIDRTCHPDPTPPRPWHTQSSSSSNSVSVPPAPFADNIGPPPVEIRKDTLCDGIVKSLGENGLGSLPREELEELVATVIRQPGFAKLLETLDSMWTVKGYLAR